ncbi:MerR family transcriptional regulator [Chitinasiproducens palmae]|uniref:DNA-binding transcriptional regulator, MerR family n=1 Tax=Chitinasiproducens palmae TaxID=1770053 RepID=A0A1H2PJH7_9BURK|nr:MerR family transcriptional regulator [Chitinasiproducens palmae]SDV46403.1 DNA-binding transcriptional regulator, MerR family [Chitinasiproducens palmae]
MKIGELARRTGLSAHTLRYYERIGLLPATPRDGGGQRDYNPSVLTWLAFLGRLKQTGMPIREMLRYAQLRAAGPATSGQRQALLTVHRDEVRQRIALLQAALAVLDDKIAGYAGAAGSIERDTHTAKQAHPARKPPRTRPADVERG